MNEIFLSIVIPCFDELVNLQKGVLVKLHDFLKTRKYSFEVIIVDDGSMDGSVAFLEKFTSLHKDFSLIKNRHLGKSGSVTTGVLKAKGSFILFTDMDQATPISEVDSLLIFAREGYDIVIGSRNARKGAPWTRAVMSQGMILLRKIIVGIYDISDTQCGFKLFSKKSAKNLFTEIKSLHSGFSTVKGSKVSAGFDVELLYLARRMGYSIKEAPVDWLYVETRRVNPIWDSIDGLIALIQIRINAVKGVYK
ncbi:glycosyl transferase [Candidatus Levyibacteriota bacterium]|nr:glycosyltransferase [Candidatus Levybacteria bacterium]GDX61782.1 glycosyl transferase [Candidatus Levybacteria bacterium]